MAARIGEWCGLGALGGAPPRRINARRAEDSGFWVSAWAHKKLTTFTQFADGMDGRDITETNN